MSLERDISAEVKIPAGSVLLEGNLEIPARAKGIVIFAHGSGSSRHSRRNKFVAGIIRERGFGTLLFDLLTPEEERVDIYTRHLRFDIEMLAERLLAVAEWLGEAEETKNLPLGFFGASTGGGAALAVAAKLGKKVGAVVSRGGRPDLAGPALSQVEAPVLLIVGGADEPVIELNKEALAALHCRKELTIVPGATHLFEEPGALRIVAETAGEWFVKHLKNESSAAAEKTA